MLRIEINEEGSGRRRALCRGDACLRLEPCPGGPSETGYSGRESSDRAPGKAHRS